MAKIGDNFSSLLAVIFGIANEEVDELFDLSKLPPKMMEVEKKYRLAKNGDDIDGVISKFFYEFTKFLEEGRITVQKLITYIGVDQYFIIEKNNNRFVFRYRAGADRPPQLTVKFQIKKDSNLVRGEINLDVRREEPEKIRAFMAIICGLGDSYQLFTTRQNGNIWLLKECDENLIEVVVYKISRASSLQQIEAFVEIESLCSKNIEQAMEMIEKYEKGLGLNPFICKESIAEIFGKR